MFIMVAERRVNDASLGSVDGLEGAEYLKEVISNWTAELQKIYDDTVGMTVKETIPLKNVGELRELQLQKNEDYHEGAVCNVGTTTDELTNVIAEPGEVICRTHENAVVEMDGEVVAVASVQDAEKSVTLKEACNPTKSDCVSTRETTQDIPDTPAKFAREWGEVGIQTRRPGPVTSKDYIKSNRQFGGRSRINKIGEREEIWETERRVRGKMGLGRDTELYMMSEGRRVDWGGLGRIQAGGTVDMGLTMKGGRRKRKTKNGNRWESLASGGESEESDGSGRDSLDEELYAEVLEETLSKAEEEGGPMHELVETLAVLGKEG